MSHICMNCGSPLYCKQGFLQCVNPMCRKYKVKQFTLNLDIASI